MLMVEYCLELLSGKGLSLLKAQISTLSSLNLAFGNVDLDIITFLTESSVPFWWKSRRL